MATWCERQCDGWASQRERVNECESKRAKAKGVRIIGGQNDQNTRTLRVNETASIWVDKWIVCNESNEIQVLFAVFTRECSSTSSASWSGSPSSDALRRALNSVVNGEVKCLSLEALRRPLNGVHYDGRDADKPIGHSWWMIHREAILFEREVFDAYFDQMNFVEFHWKLFEVQALCVSSNQWRSAPL